jgi:hypothetical protein
MATPEDYMNNDMSKEIIRLDTDAVGMENLRLSTTIYAMMAGIMQRQFEILHLLKHGTVDKERFDEDIQKEVAAIAEQSDRMILDCVANISGKTKE